MMKGVVIAVIRKNNVRPGGYGFLIDEEQVERFWHASNLVDLNYDDESVVKEGLEVEFEPFEHPTKGPRAQNVRRR